MYIICCLKVLVLSLFLLFTSKTNLAFSKNTDKVPPNSFEGLVLRVKKGLNSFTDCSVDTLLEHCDKETTKNFECFRSLGECISLGFKTALLKEKVKEEKEAPNTNDEVTLTEESGRCVVFDKNECAIRSFESHTDDSDSKFLFNCYGVLGSMSFLGRRYLAVITDAKKIGRLLLEYDVYSITSQKLIPLFHPVNLSSEEREFLRVFNDFDISNNFYFSYTYNLSNSLQLNLSYKSHLIERGLNNCEEWMIFDPVLMDQKYCYNFSHKMDLCAINEKCFNLSLAVIHGYFSESALNVSGRSMTFSLVSRRSRFFSGTRYRKRGITGSGYVANDVETEQILHDWGVTSSVSSFVLMRGSIPIFWSQDPNDSFLIKPPIIYPHNDPTNSSARAHFKQMLSCYGAPVVVLNLLSDNPYTEEGNLSQRYKNVVDELNSELPTFLKIMYFSKNIKSLLEKGVAKQMLKEVVDVVLENIKLLHIPKFKGMNGSFSSDNSRGTNGDVTNIETSSIGVFRDFTNCDTAYNSASTNVIVPKTSNKDIVLQTGVIRVSCLDCLDRTSSFSKHLSLRIFKHQLELIGINVDYEQSTCLISNYTPKQVAFNTAREQSIGSERSIDDILSRSGIEGNTGSLREETIIASDYFGFNQVKGLLFELIKDRYEQMCDELSMQYAGSKALRKYEGRSRVINMSRELFTTVRRRYRSFFEDTKIQEQTNFFLYSNVLSYYSQIGVNVVKNDLDDLIHFKPIPIEFNNTDALILALIVYKSRVMSLKKNLMGLVSRESACRFGGLEQLCTKDTPDVTDATEDEIPSSNTPNYDFKHPVYSDYFNLVLDKMIEFKINTTRTTDTSLISPIATNIDSTTANTNSECCSIHDKVEFKKKALAIILTNYLTVQDQKEIDYTDLSLYKPAEKVINLINAEPIQKRSAELTSPSILTSCSVPSDGMRGVDDSSQSPYGLSLKENRSDYAMFLMPTYTYDKDQWSLEPRCDINSLQKFIEIRS
ncbi:hypothetical protein MACJ_000724 [Theileria orientalis]|uniref:SAC domain-containing protein n=1 Tax=Theileria orientalis TaxID=68886 RepID=A0A976M4I4_THEOR|nr:hypothetical protein MACJ_000724 [Theileria orientalis]